MTQGQKELAHVKKIGKYKTQNAGSSNDNANVLRRGRSVVNICMNDSYEWKGKNVMVLQVKNLESIISENPFWDAARNLWWSPCEKTSITRSLHGGGWNLRSVVFWSFRVESKPSSMIPSPRWKSVRWEVALSPALPAGGRSQIQYQWWWMNSHPYEQGRINGIRCAYGPTDGHHLL